MDPASLLIVQLMAAGLGLFCVLIGWFVRGWSVRQQLRAKDAVLEGRQAQISTLEGRVDDFNKLRPLQVRDYLGGLIHECGEAASVLESEATELNSRLDVLTEQIDQGRDRVSVSRLKIAELEDRKASLHEFTGALRRVIRDAHKQSTTYFEPGEKAVRATEADIEAALAQIGAEQEKIETESAGIRDLESQAEDLRQELNRVRRRLSAIRDRRDQLRVASDLVAGDSPAEIRRRHPAAGNLAEADAKAPAPLFTSFR